MKKNLILVVAFLFAAKLASAQTEQGTQNLGLNLSYGHNSTNGNSENYSDYSLYPTTNKTTYFDIGPSYSYFIANKLDIGADLFYMYNSSVITPDNYPEKQVEHQFGGDIFLRKYFMTSDKFGFRAGPYAGYQRFNNDYTYPQTLPGNATHTSDEQFYGGAKLDLVYYPVKHFGLSLTLANLEYSHEKNNEGVQGNSKTNSLSFAVVTTQTAIGIFYVFGGK